MQSVVSIWLKCNLSSHSFISAAYWKGNIALLREQLPRSEVYVYLEGCEIAAFAGLSGDYIAGLFVRAESRSKGIGSELVEHIRQRHAKLSLAVYKKNDRAVKFYLREGFRIDGEQTDTSTKEEEFVMRWERQKG